VRKEKISFQEVRDIFAKENPASETVEQAFVYSDKVARFLYSAKNGSAATSLFAFFSHKAAENTGKRLVNAKPA
jgi:hypothetical protein